MIDGGPDPQGSGPPSSPDGELERARRQLYGRGGASATAVAEYERLAAGAAERAAAARPDRHLDEVTAPLATPDRRSPFDGGRRFLLIAGGAFLAVIALVAVAVAPRPLPPRVDVPALGGTTLLAFERASDPAIRPRSITYQPEGNTVYQVDGRFVAVALRCVGEGTVRISAGVPFDFRCTTTERRLVTRGARPWSGPFVIVGTTTGNVVWAARIVLLPRQNTGGSIPTFRVACDRCSVVKG